MYSCIYVSHNQDHLMNKKALTIMIFSSVLSFFGCKKQPQESKEEIEMNKKQ